MSLDFTSSANHAEAASSPLTTASGWMTVWVKPASAAQFRRFLTIVNSADSNQMQAISTSAAAVDTKPGFYAAAGSGNAQSANSDNMTLGQWYCLLYGMAGTNNRNFQATGLTTVSKTGVFNPAGLNSVLLSGRPGDRTQNAGCPMAHAAIGSARDMTAIEKLYVVGGGNLRAVSNLASLWRCNRIVSSKIPDEVGGIDLSITGTLSAGADDPAVATWFTKGPMANIIVKVGAPISVNLGTMFESVNSAYTCAVMQLGSATAATTTTSATSATGNEVQVSSSAAFSSGDYIKIGTSAAMPVLFVNQAAGTILFDGPATWANGDTVYRVPASARAIGGLTVTANVLAGNASGNVNFPNCFVRATCNANAALFADSNTFIYQSSATSPTALTFRPRRRRVCVKVFSRR
jgi:hypothetical protein